MWQEFKEFVLRGNVVDMAVGIINCLSYPSRPPVARIARLRLSEEVKS